MSFAALFLLAALGAPVETAPVRVLLVTGGHDYEITFYKLFEDQPDLRVTARPHPGPFARNLAERCDVIVLYDMVQENVIGEAGQKNLRRFLESGKGLVVLHHALASYNSWDWWSREVVGAKYFLKPEGDRPQSTYRHDVDLSVQPVGEHPVLSGIGPFQIRDETYKGMWMSPDNTVLLRTEHPASDGPVAWISPYRQSRVVVIQLGHDHAAHLHPAYQRLVRNAIRWSAGKLNLR